MPQLDQSSPPKPQTEQGPHLRANDEEQASFLMEAKEVVMEAALQGKVHPDAFHVSGPRNVASPNWRDLINSSWKDANYKRTVIACLIQAVYLLECDRQDNRTKDNALAPTWSMSFKYKLSQTLIDERDGSIFGATLEWDQVSARSNFILVRPSGAPKAILAIRGTLLKSLTIRRDIEDDLRFLAWESLKGSVRFNIALEALRSVAKRYGNSNVCVAGHSLGAGFALQVGKALAQEGVYVDAHLFNPPSYSVAMSLRNIGEKAGFVWKRLRSMLPYGGETQAIAKEGECCEKTPTGLQKWVPHLYVNNGDYVCCHYTDLEGEESNPNKENVKAGVVAKLFIMSKGKQTFLEAHRLEQWWSDDLDLQLALNSSQLISRQLKSLYSLSPQLSGRPR